MPLQDIEGAGEVDMGYAGEEMAWVEGEDEMGRRRRVRVRRRAVSPQQGSSPPRLLPLGAEATVAAGALSTTFSIATQEAMFIEHVLCGAGALASHDLFVVTDVTVGTATIRAAVGSFPAWLFRHDSLFKVPLGFVDAGETVGVVVKNITAATSGVGMSAGVYGRSAKGKKAA